MEKYNDLLSNHVHSVDSLVKLVATRLRVAPDRVYVEYKSLFSTDIRVSASVPNSGNCIDFSNDPGRICYAVNLVLFLQNTSVVPFDFRYIDPFSDYVAWFRFSSNTDSVSSSSNYFSRVYQPHLLFNVVASPPAGLNFFLNYLEFSIIS
ncbi:MAG: hypothetical protein FWF54_00610 [Candidatus Azobacteroides sp.]|nr:hypothetical protein [Candidatus Azobacteroides sp.]